MSLERTSRAAVGTSLRRSEWTTHLLRPEADEIAKGALLLMDAIAHRGGVRILTDGSTAILGEHLLNGLGSCDSVTAEIVHVPIGASADSDAGAAKKRHDGRYRLLIALAGGRDSLVIRTTSQLQDRMGGQCVLVAPSGAPDLRNSVTVTVPCRESTRLVEAQLLIVNCLVDAVRAGLKREDTDPSAPDSFPFVLDRAELTAFRSWVDSSGQVLVTTNGCFDGFHVGHQYSLRAARRLGDILVVAVNDDDSVRRLKGAPRPLSSLEARIESLAEFPAVDHVVVMHEPDPRDLLAVLKPHVHCKGEDYRGRDVVEAEVVRTGGGTLTFLPLVDGMSTTALRRGTRDATDLSPAGEGVAGK